MTETQPKEPQSTLGEELSRMAKNLLDAVHAGWEEQERKQLEREVSGELGNILRTWREDSSGTGGNPLSARVRSDDARMGLQRDVILALQEANTRLQAAAARWIGGKVGEQQAHQRQPAGAETAAIPNTGGNAAHTEVHPDDVDSAGTSETGHQEIHPDDVDSSHSNITGNEGG